MYDSTCLTTIIQRLLRAAAAACALAVTTGSGALADVPPKADSAKSKPMNMDEPMAGGMKKDGMKKGDVKKAAAKKDREMREMIEQEQRSAAAVKK